MGLQSEGRKRGGEISTALDVVQAAPDGVESIGKRVFPRQRLGGVGQEPVVGRIQVGAVIGHEGPLAAIRDAKIVVNPEVSQLSGGEDIGRETLVRLAAELEDAALVEIGDGRVPTVDGGSFGTGKRLPVVDPVGDVVSSGGESRLKGAEFEHESVIESGNTILFQESVSWDIVEIDRASVERSRQNPQRTANHGQCGLSPPGKGGEDEDKRLMMTKHGLLTLLNIIANRNIIIISMKAGSQNYWKAPSRRENTLEGGVVAC